MIGRFNHIGRLLCYLKNISSSHPTDLSLGAHAQELTDGDIVDGEVIQSATVDNSAIQSIEQDGKRYTTVNLSDYAKQVDESTWSPNMKVNTAMTVKMQVLLDWNHASPGPVDGGWGMNSKSTG